MAKGPVRPKSKSSPAQDPIDDILAHATALGIPPAIPGRGATVPVLSTDTTVMGATVSHYPSGEVSAIMIRADQPKPFVHETLLHELLHVIETHALKEGIISRRFPERVIEFFSGELLIHLAGSGLYKPISQKEMYEWTSKGQRAHRRKLMKELK